MKNDGFYLVINLGLRSIRAILYDSNLNILEKNWYPVKTFLGQESVEQDPLEWWLLAEKLIDETLDKNSTYRKVLKYITVTSSSCCLVALDKNGNPLLRSLIVSDKRAQKEAEEIGGDSRFKQIFENKNFHPMASYMLPKIYWVKKNLQDEYKKVHFFMGSNDYLLYKLTGRVVTDPLNAEKFYYDQNAGSYPEGLLKFLELSHSCLPKVVPIGSEIGSLRIDLQKKLKLSADVKVIITTYDAVCAFVGSGISEEGEAANICGTVSSLRVLSRKHISDETLLSQSLYDYFILGGSNNIDGGLLEWSKNMFYGDAYSEEYVYKIMEDEARESRLGAGGLIFVPYILGERFPFRDEKVRGIFFGLERYHRRNDMIRSIFEASSFMTLSMLEKIKNHGIAVKKIRMSGGFARSQLLCKIRADVTGCPVDQLEEVEITSLGALFIMLHGTKKIKNFKKVAETIRVKQTFYPDKHSHTRYQKLYSLFKDIYVQSKDLMKTRHELMVKFESQQEYVLENL